MEPFAVTVSTARSLPDAPATRDALRACAPVACRVRWAGMPVATVEAARGETDWVAADATVGGADVGAKAVTQKVPEKKPRAYATRRFGADVGDEPSRTHTRDVTFGRSVLWFGCDVPSETYPEGMVSACGEAVQVRVYDRSAPPDPDPFPVASATEADGEKASDVTVTGEDEDGTKNENANENDDAGMDEETEAAREAERRASLCLEFPDAESAAYGFASFDVRHMARRSNAPIVTPRAFASMEAPLVPCAMSRSGAASWRTRPGRFLEAGSTVTLTVEMAVPRARGRRLRRRRRRRETRKRRMARLETKATRRRRGWRRNSNERRTLFLSRRRRPPHVVLSCARRARSLATAGALRFCAPSSPRRARKTPKRCARTPPSRTPPSRRTTRAFGSAWQTRRFRRRGRATPTTPASTWSPATTSWTVPRAKSPWRARPRRSLRSPRSSRRAAPRRTPRRATRRRKRSAETVTDPGAS